MALYDHEGTRGLAPSSILGQAPRNWPPEAKNENKSAALCFRPLYERV